MNTTVVSSDEHSGSGDNRADETLESGNNNTPKPNRDTPSIFDPFFKRFGRPIRYRVSENDESTNTEAKEEVTHPDYTTPPKPARPDKPAAQLPQPKTISEPIQPTQSNVDVFSTPMTEVGEFFTPKPFPKGAMYKEWIKTIAKDHKMDVDEPPQYRETKETSSDSVPEHGSSGSEDETFDLSTKLEASFKEEKPFTLRPARFNNAQTNNEQPSTSHSAQVSSISFPSSVPSSPPLEQVHNELKKAFSDAALRRQGLSPSKLVRFI